LVDKLEEIGRKPWLNTDLSDPTPDIFNKFGKEALYILDNKLT
jgi:hypothetical protein